MLSQAEYESMDDLEEKKFGEILIKKILYCFATGMLNTSEAKCCVILWGAVHSSWLGKPCGKVSTIDSKLLHSSFTFNIQ
ncbi:MAG: hypothetical protein QXY49_01280 [Thermofilaceae archaeon]